MAAVNEPKTREEIQKAFAQLLRTHEARASQISTKAEEAVKLADRETVERASGYTVEGIINSLAKLQLSFGSAVEQISAQLGEESGKLGEVRRAIVVETQRLEELRATIVAAEALAILKRDHEQKLAAFEEEAAAARQELSDEISEQRQEWQREQKELESSGREYDHNLAKERGQAAEDHKYDAERQSKVEGDENAVKRRELLRELADEQASKEKDWAVRDKVLDENAKEIEELREKVAGFANELEQAQQKAREKAIAAVNREAKFEVEMLDKEHASTVKVNELKVQTLEERIKRQAEQIAELSNKLDTTIAKSQSLAEQAFKRPTPSTGA